MCGICGVWVFHVSIDTVSRPRLFYFGGSNGFVRSNAGLVLLRPRKGKPAKIVPPPSEPPSEGKLRSSFRLRSLRIGEAAIFDEVLGKVSEMREVNEDLARLASC